MLQTRLFLGCDGDGCGNTFPRIDSQDLSRFKDFLPLSGAVCVDGAFWTPTLLRSDAALSGWTRMKGRDLCSDCTFLYRAEAKGGK